MDKGVVTVWVHKDNFSEDDVLVAPDVLGENALHSQTLMEVVAVRPSPHQTKQQDDPDDTIPASYDARSVVGRNIENGNSVSATRTKAQPGSLEMDPQSRFFFIAKPMTAELRASQPKLQVSITTSIANAFGYRSSTQAQISFANTAACSASHVELVFRDQYLSRADMWRLARSTLVGRTVYRGQKIVFMGTIKATVQQIYLHGSATSSAYFCATTIPVFRSQSSRYVLFIQMSREMWDFDAEGTGEILFSRVIDGFLPELFKKWELSEVRHLVSIVLFGRLEYDCHVPSYETSLPKSTEIEEQTSHRDFYRVVTTDMVSWQWKVILNRLRKEFLVFLRDTRLHQSGQSSSNGDLKDDEGEAGCLRRINGQPTSALRGNFLEAVNMASAQYATGHSGRDLIRMGDATVVLTPGTGMFEVDRQLLVTTSENLASNGVVVDLVCLSSVPLHPVPLFKWSKKPRRSEYKQKESNFSTQKHTVSKVPRPSLQLRRNASGSTSTINEKHPPSDICWCYGIPQWIDVSYWTAGSGQTHNGPDNRSDIEKRLPASLQQGHFTPRVRMYELQMMGVMELGLANISIPYLSTGHKSRHLSRGKRSLPSVVSESTDLTFDNSVSSLRSLASSRLASPQHQDHRKPGLLALEAQKQGELYAWMDLYDSRLFRMGRQRPPQNQDGGTDPRAIQRHSLDISTYQPGTSPIQAAGRGSKYEDHLMQKPSAVTPRAISRVASSSHASPTNGPGSSKISRAVSFALRGLGSAAPRAVASTEIRMENIQGDVSISSPLQQKSPEISSKESNIAEDDRPHPAKSLSTKNDQHPSREAEALTEDIMEYARPISIQHSGKRKPNFDSTQNTARPGKETSQPGQQNRPASASRDSMSASSDSTSSCSETTVENESDFTQPDADISPWVKVINPANPSQVHAAGAKWVGRWQHLCPRPPKVSTVKWKSLCNPAAVPLTTDGFPSRDEWQRRYIRTTYVVSQAHETEKLEPEGSRRSLLREMIELRLSQGYQIVAGRRVRRAVGPDVASLESCFTSKILVGHVAPVYMSKGASIQRLSFVNDHAIEVSQFMRNDPEDDQPQGPRVEYEPVMKTVFSNVFAERKIELDKVYEEYPWKLADSYLAGREEGKNEVMEQLRPWRARFVVIPFELPPGDKRPAQTMSEDNDEEIHLLGIRELTKMWQKMRYVAPEEGHFRATDGQHRDPNPLEIMFQTLNPSEVVATELEKLLAVDDSADVQAKQLLPESDLLERSTTSLVKIAQELQGERGVEIANRRWHLRLHHSCFKGDDFTNWLLSSFKDIESREEAVSFGNELMQHGLFQHVSTRHMFKDGNYFYTIAPDYRVPRLDPKNALISSSRRPDRSVPATPLSDSGSYASLPSSHSHPHPSTLRPLDGRGPDMATQADKRQASVALSKMMCIDVDHRKPKRSEQQELVYLHYDRLHNPENCYHLQLSWLNVTSKLVDDAVSTWTTQLERYGLHLAEVPLAEACEIPKYEPFREAYQIRLKLPPPLGHIGDGNASTDSPNMSSRAGLTLIPDKLVYHKQILKKFHFVLDLEASSLFPADVDVLYAYGQLKYRYSQYVHRSGQILCQVTDDGDFLLISNRLHSARSGSGKEAKMELRQETPHQQTGVGHSESRSSLHPRASHPSPLGPSKGEGLGSRGTLDMSSMTDWVEPSCVREELEAFCQDAEKLQAFYKETIEQYGGGGGGGGGSGRRNDSDSSTALRPLPEQELESSIPDLRLPASVVLTDKAGSKAGRMGLRTSGAHHETVRTATSPLVQDVDDSH